jgi:hypothetical protein
MMLRRRCILANHVGDPEVLSEAIALAKSVSSPAEPTG